MAVLSGKVPNYVPPDLRDNEGWCRLATDGLQGKLKDLHRDETGTVHTRGTQSGIIPLATGRPISTSGMPSMLMQLARQPTSGSTSTASVMGVVVTTAQNMVVASSRREHTTASTRIERTTSVPPPLTDGLLRSDTAASPMSMFSKHPISNRLCSLASPLIIFVLCSFRRCCSKPTASVLQRASCFVATFGLGRSAAVRNLRMGARIGTFPKVTFLRNCSRGQPRRCLKVTWTEQLTQQHRLPRRRRRQRRDLAARQRR